ncbi:MAG: M2 family metallopeptidase [Gemmatimonadales bacterium]|nr:M2 family metallopeptidase [Gemmatimonadales bacterium]
MKVRTIAGLGMTLLAAGLMTIFFLNPDFPGCGFTNPGGDTRESTSDEAAKDSPDEIADFLAQYNATYRSLWTDAATADWTSRTLINPENSTASREAKTRLADFTGSDTIVRKLGLYRNRMDLNDLQDRQIEKAWQLASHTPAAGNGEAAALSAKAIAILGSMETFLYAATGQTDPGGSLGKVDPLMTARRDTADRRALWESRLAVGPNLKDGVLELRELRNAQARKMGYSSFFSLKAADYDLTGPELIRLMDEFTTGIEPLYLQLHCWVKHELARRYGADPSRRIPAHWLSDPWGQTWSGVIESADMDTHFRDVQPQWIIEEAERFYLSLGFDPLPLTFWGRSDLFLLGADSRREKSSLDVSLHLDLAQDARSLLHLQRDFASFMTAHQQLGIVYYQLAYSRPEIPPVLRRGGSRALPLALGALGSLAARQIPYLEEVGVLPKEETPEEIRWLMSQALTGPVVSIPFLSGTMAHWEHDLYEEDLPRHQFNTRYWEYAGRYQGLKPAVSRGEEYCDPAALPLLHLEPACAYDKAIAEVIMHQLHSFICRDILKQGLREANYAGNRKVGMLLHSIMEPGATRDWAQVLRQATGEAISAQGMVDYYQPLLEWLQIQNQGRDIEF